MNKIIGLVVFMLVVSGMQSFAQQQFTYTQYIDNLTPINPAWSTTRQVSELNLLARQQWVNVDGAPRTFMASGSFAMNDIGSAAGFTSMTDRVGPESLTEFNAFFAKSVRLKDDLYLSTALNGGFRNYNILYSTLLSDDPLIANADVRDNRFNMGASVMAYIANKFYAGISIPRINLGNANGQIGAVGYFRNFYFVNLGYSANLNSDFRLEAASVLAYTANVPLQLDVSSKMWIREILGLGLNLRSNNESALLTSYRVGNFNLGYSYSFVFGNRRVAGFQNATHELTVGIRFGEGAVDPRTWSRGR
ncbi:MAG: type IX secretion system membrane protein PorP/SprF [Pedobacter sp.]|nr:MAG: type IX secretion system membrane protein PorP/SprF [Pedobacter sp.]